MQESYSMLSTWTNPCLQMMIARLADKGQTMVSREEAEAMAKELGAVSYAETSSLRCEGLTDLFAIAIDTITRPRPRGPRPSRRPRPGGCGLQ